MPRPESSRDLPSPRAFLLLSRGRRRIDTELCTQQSQLVTFDVGDRDSAPPLRAADQRSEHELHRGALVGEAWYDLGAAAFLLETPLDEVRGPAVDAVTCRQPHVRQQAVQALGEAGDRGR